MGRHVAALAALAMTAVGTNGFVARHSRALPAPVARSKARLGALDSFGDRVEAGLLTLFDPKEVSRVVDAWRAMRRGDELQRPVPLAAGGSAADAAAAAGHPLLVQECNSWLAGLEPVQCFYDAAGRPTSPDAAGAAGMAQWAAALEAAWPQVQAEFLSVLGDQARLEAEGSNVWVGPLAGTEVAAAYGSAWKTLGLFDRAEWEEANVALFPVTAQLLAGDGGCGAPLVEALFAKMPAGSRIKAHSDMSNFVLTAHLGVDVPPGCWLQVGSERRTWANGQVLVFDTSVLHEAANEHPTKDRYVLMLRVWHPATTAAERQALQFVFDAVADPNLVEDDNALFLYDQLDAQRAKYYKDLIANL